MNHENSRMIPRMCWWGRTWRDETNSSWIQIRLPIHRTHTTCDQLMLEFHAGIRLKWYVWRFAE
jgi:hypothetical protein